MSTGSIFILLALIVAVMVVYFCLGEKVERSSRILGIRPKRRSSWDSIRTLPRTTRRNAGEVKPIANRKRKPLQRA